MDGEDTNGWSEWKNHVLAELKRLNETLADHTKSDTDNFNSLNKSAQDNYNKLVELISTNRVNSAVDIATLKTKSSLWGSISGFIVSTIVAIVAAWIGK